MYKEAGPIACDDCVRQIGWDGKGGEQIAAAALKTKAPIKDDATILNVVVAIADCERIEILCK